MTQEGPRRVGRRRMIGLLIGVGVVAAAAPITPAVVRRLSDDGEEAGPPDLRVGADRCARCSMIISDVEFACGYRDADGGERVFDDIGCMLAYEREQAPGDPVAFWVHDYASGTWLEASGAWFVRSSGIQTPMSSGLAAYADEAAAVAAAEEKDGTLFRFAELRAAAGRS